jgi:hypothetical protein
MGAVFFSVMQHESRPQLRAGLSKKRRSSGRIIWCRVFRRLGDLNTADVHTDSNISRISSAVGATKFLCRNSEKNCSIRVSRILLQLFTVWSLCDVSGLRSTSLFRWLSLYWQSFIFILVSVERVWDRNQISTISTRDYQGSQGISVAK